MSKITLNDVGNLIDATTAATTINDNSAVIVAAIDNTLSRDGTAPNQMESDLDMNSHSIINVKEIAIDEGDIITILPATNVRGSLIYRGVDAWEILPPGPAGSFLGSAGANTDPTWNSASGTGDMVKVVYDPDAFLYDIYGKGLRITTGVSISSRTIPSSVDYLLTQGYATIGDLGDARYIKVVGEPSHEGKFQSVDGAWWELEVPKVRFEHLGAFGSPIGTSFSSVSDELTELQYACDYAEAKCGVVEVTARYFGIDGELEIASGVSIDGGFTGGAIINKSTTSGLRVYSNSKLVGNLIILGTGTTNLIERCVYPAEEPCADVELDITVGNATVGVQADYFTSVANQPRRWKGTVRSHPSYPIVGQQGNSEGYLFLGTLRDSNFKIFGKNTARHDYYIAAGATNNYAEVHSEGCMNYSTQINTYAGQPESSGNYINVFAKNLGRGVVGSSGACAIVGNSGRNTIEVSQSGSGTDYCVLVQGADDASTTPRGNRIICRDVNGTFLGSAVINLTNEDSTQVSGSIVAKATDSVIGMFRSGTSGATHAAIIENVSVDTFGADIYCVWDAISDIPSYVGHGKYKNTATSPTLLPIRDGSSGLRSGYGVEYSGTYSANGAAGAATTSYNIVMPGKIDPTYKKPAISLVPGFPDVTSNVPINVLAGTVAYNSAALPFGVYNGHSASQNIPIFWRIAGDPAL